MVVKYYEPRCGVLFKISYEQPHPVFIGVTPPAGSHHECFAGHHKRKTIILFLPPHSSKYFLTT